MLRLSLRWLPRLAVLGALLLAGPGLALWLSPPETRAELVYISGPEPETLDPALATGVLEIRLLGALFEGLVRLEADSLRPVPAAAERIEVEPGFRRFRFHLRRGLCWSDGAPLDGRDFLWAWRRAADPLTRAPLWREAAAVAAAARLEGPYTIVVELAGPAPELLSKLTLPCFLPVPRHVIERAGERWTRPPDLVGNGPFCLAQWRVGHRLLLVRNERYREPAGLRSIEALTMSGATVSADTAFLLYETGVADLAFSMPEGVSEALAGRPDLHVGPALSTSFLRFNVTRPPLDDLHVRRALTMAIDRRRIARRVVRGGERPTSAFVPPGLAGYVPAAGLGYDLAAARRELALRRPGAALRFELLYAASDASAGHVAEVLQAAWGGALGVGVRLRPMERKAYYAAMRRLEYDVCWSSWVADYPDPANFLDIFRAGSGNNRTGFASSAYDGLLDRAAAAEKASERLGLLSEAEALLLGEAPLAPLYHPLRAILCRPRIGGLRPNPQNLIDWRALYLVHGREVRG